MGRTDLRPDITKEVLEEYIRKGKEREKKWKEKNLIPVNT